MPRAPDRGPLPAVGRCVEIRRELGLVGAPRVGFGLRAQRVDALGTEPGEVLVLVVDLEHPVARSSRRSRRGASRRAPRPRTRSPRRTRRRGDRRRRGHRGGHRAAPRTPRARGARGCARGAPTASRSSTTFSTVTIAPRVAASAPHTPSRSGGCTATLPARSATGACSSVTSGTSGASRPTSPNGVSTRAYASFCGHRRPDDRARGDGGEPTGRRLEALREREERPVLDLDIARSVCAGEDRVRREVGEGVAGVAGHDLADEPTAEEQRAEARQARHQEREAGVALPPLAHELARRGGPARVAGDETDRVTGLHVCSDRVAQRRALLGHAADAMRDRGPGRRAGDADGPDSRASRRSASPACNRSARRSPR